MNALTFGFMLFFILAGLITVHESTHYVLATEHGCDAWFSMKGIEPATEMRCTMTDADFTELQRSQDLVEIIQYPLIIMFFIFISLWLIAHNEKI